MNVNIIKKLGSGVMGTVYLSKIDGQPTITKVEKYDGDLTTKSPYIRQLIFNEKIALKHPDRFMTLVSSGVINDCKHKQQLPDFVKNAPPKIQAYHKLRESWTKCFILSYKPILKYTLNDVLLKNWLTSSNKLKIFKYLKKSIEIMNKEGFYHRDIHYGNIMCDEKLENWYIIDYGAIYHESFIKNTDDKFIGTFSKIIDIISLIWAFIENPIADYMIKHKIKWPPFKKFIKHITNDDRFLTIQKYLSKNIDTLFEKECITIICCLLFYDLYIDAIGMTNTPIGKKYKDYKQDNKNIKYFLNIIKNL